MAYHFAAALAPISGQRSRLSGLPPRGGAIERPGLLELLRGLAAEKAIRGDARTFRIGLAATNWQLRQATGLLDSLGLPNPLDTFGKETDPEKDRTADRVVALAMNTSLNSHENSALATIWLRRDGAAGLALDRSHARTMAKLRAEGRKLIAMEVVAFDRDAPVKLLLEPMLKTLESHVLTTWDATDILVESPRADAAFYCSKLGFVRMPEASGKNGPILLRLSISRPPSRERGLLMDNSVADGQLQVASA